MTIEKDKLPKMGVDFSFAPKHKCGGLSPEIRLSGVPAGTAKYEIGMTDLDVPSFRHWNQTVPANGPVIGPCPPSGTHRYQVEVIARDAQNNPVGYGEKTVVTGQ